MMKHFFLILVFFCHFEVLAQNDSITNVPSLKKQTFLKQSIIPLSLLGSGIIVHFTVKEQWQENLQERLNNFQTSADNFSLFAPAVIMYGADLFKVPARNNAFTQTKYLAIAGITNSLVTLGLKYASNVTRPDGDAHSFPSGHTSNAFVMATVLHHEFIDSNPYIAYSGYFFATATGVLRVLNNRHWISDVLVGAGLGILITDLVYRFEPLKNWNPYKKEKGRHVIISPVYIDNTLGLYANIQF